MKTFISALFLAVLLPAAAKADCYARCKPSIFFPERTDCRSWCDDSDSAGSYESSHESSGPFYGGIRIAGMVPMGQSGILSANGATFMGYNNSQLASKSASQQGLGLALEFTNTTDGIGPVYDLGGWSQPVTVNGQDAGSMATIQIGLGLEAGVLIHKLRTRLHVRATYDYANVSYYDHANAPEYKDTMNFYGMLPIVGAGLDFRLKKNSFLSLAFRMMLGNPEMEGYSSSGPKMNLQLGNPVLLLGYAYIP